MKPGRRSATSSPCTPNTPGTPDTRSQTQRVHGKRSVRALHKDFEEMAVECRQSPRKRLSQHTELSPAKKTKLSPSVNSSQESVATKSFYKAGKVKYMSPLERASLKKNVLDEDLSPESSYADKYFDSQKLHQKKEDKKNAKNSPYLNSSFSKQIKKYSRSVKARQKSGSNTFSSNKTVNVLSEIKPDSTKSPSKNIINSVQPATSSRQSPRNTFSSINSSQKPVNVLSEIKPDSTKSPIKNIIDSVQTATSPRRSPRRKFFKSRSCASAGKLNSRMTLQNGKLTFQGRQPDAIARKEAKLANRKTKKPLAFVTTDKVTNKAKTQQKPLLTKPVNIAGKENQPLKPTYRDMIAPVNCQGTSPVSNQSVLSVSCNPHSQELFSSQETLKSNSPSKSDVSEQSLNDLASTNSMESPNGSKKGRTNSPVVKSDSNCDNGNENELPGGKREKQELVTSNDACDISPQLISSSEDAGLSQSSSGVAMADSSRGHVGDMEGDVSNTSSGSVLLLSEGSRGSDAAASIEEVGKVASTKRYFPIFSPPGTPSSTSSLSQRLSSNPSTPTNQKTTMAGILKSNGKAKQSPKILKKLVDKDGKEQMILDFGQKLVGVIQCDDCGMNYTPGEPTDEATHSKFHQRILSALKFPGWKKENVFQEFPDGSRIIVVLPGEKQAMKKVDLVRAIVDEDLGFVVSSQNVLDRCKTFLFISDDKRVVGCCIAEAISKAYRVIADSGTQPDSEKKDGQTQRPWCCSTEPEKAKIGINRIWVLSCQRRKKIASKLLDCVRFNFLLGYPLAREALAFTDPTPSGRQFATQYTGTRSFLVYKH